MGLKDKHENSTQFRAKRLRKTTHINQGDFLNYLVQAVKRYHIEYP